MHDRHFFKLKWKERKTFLQNIGSRENERETMKIVLPRGQQSRPLGLGKWREEAVVYILR